MAIRAQRRWVRPDPAGSQLQIRIREVSHGNLEAEFQSGGAMPVAYPLAVSNGGVTDLNESLRVALEKLGGWFENGDADDRAEATAQLLDAGRTLFNTVFKGSTREALLKLLARPAGRSRIIQVTSDEAFVPCALFHHDSRSAASDRAFWGMQFVISNAIILPSASRVPPPTYIPAPRPMMGLITYRQHDLPAISQIEIPTLQRLRASGKVFLEILADLRSEDGSRASQQFWSFVSGERDLLHFACHALENKLVRASRLRVHADLDVPLDDFDRHDVSLDFGPFVMLNACRGAVIRPLNTFGWAREFLNRGARGILAPEIDIPDALAAAFAKTFYSLFLRGMRVGEAVRQARLKVLETDSNPLALAYSLFASPHVRIVSN